MSDVVAPECWADVWSGGQVCAFSGLDGQTRWAMAVAGRTLADRFGLALDTDPALTVAVAVDGEVLDPTQPGCCCRLDGSGARASFALATGGRLQVALVFAGHDLLRGELLLSGSAGPVTVWLELTDGGLLKASAGQFLHGEQEALLAFSAAAAARVAVGTTTAALHDEVAFEAAPAEYEGDATAGAVVYRWSLAAAEPLQFAVRFGPPTFVKRPQPEPLPAALPGPCGDEGWSRGERRTRAKAIAILRAAAFAAEGNLPRRWIVPHRLEQRNFNTFHAPLLALGALSFDVELAYDVLHCCLAQQQPNGRIPEQAWPQGQNTENPPPLIAWGFWRVYQQTRDLRLLEEGLPRLKDYCKYPLMARLLERLGHARSAGAKFLTWGHGQGSNMDNSPRFDFNEPFAAIDLTSLAIAEIDFVARMIDELTPEHREAVHLGWMGEELAQETQEYFWDPADGCFSDRYPDGDKVDARTIGCFMPLFGGVCRHDQAEAMIERHLLNPAEFWTPFPLASLAADDPRFDQNMWRGAVWPGLNVLLVAGLRRYGFDQVADELRARTLEQLVLWYEQTGSLWEYYDANGRRSPAELPRGRRVGALSDHAWTAAAFLALLEEPSRA